MMENPMGLDNGWREVFTGCMKALLALLGLSKKARIVPLKAERKRFEEEMRGQFLKLKEKGLGIRVFTL